MDDLISRQAAIELIERMKPYHQDADDIAEMIDNMSSAQPETHEKRTETHGVCLDTISRQAVYNVLDKMPVRGFKKDGETIHGLISLSQVNSAIINLPSAQPESQWISCSERLPVSDPDDLEYPTVIVCLADGSVTLACFYESTKEWGTGENFDHKCFPNKWMPLPEPYAERRTDEQTKL